jgi:hypothetical protein
LTHENVASGWASQAAPLARWAWQHLVNRSDVWGHYRDSKSDPFVDKSPLSSLVLERHFRGERVSDLIGLHTTSPENTSRWLALDVDQHGSNDAIASSNELAMKILFGELSSAGCDALLSDSDGRGSFHLLVVLDKPTPTSQVFEVGRALCRKLERLGLQRPEHFPKQPQVPDGGFGNWLRLPGRHHTRDHWSRFWTGSEWVDGLEATQLMLGKAGKPIVLIPIERSYVAAPSASTPFHTDSQDERIEAKIESLPRLREGEGRNSQAFKFACWLFQECALDADSAARRLHQLNSRHFQPMHDDEVRRILVSAEKYQGSGRDDQVPAATPLSTLADRLTALKAQLATTHGQSHIGLCSRTLPGIDDALLGFRGLSVLAAEPGIGKTSLGVQLGLDIVAAHDDACFVVFTFEMSSEEIERRMLSRTSGLPWSTLVLGNPMASKDDSDGLRLSSEDRLAFNHGCQQLHNVEDRVFIIEQNVGANLSKRWFHDCVRYAKARSRCRRAFVLVDNLQSMPIRNPSGGSWSSLDFDRYAIGLLLELQHECPDADAVMVISEQSKDTMGSARMNSALGSARIVYSADCVFFLVGADGGEGPEPQPVDFVIKKARDGMKRKRIPLLFDHVRSTFREDKDRTADVIGTDDEMSDLEGRQANSRNGTKWTGVELAYLKDLNGRNVSSRDIAEILKRSQGSVTSKLKSFQK